jgi:hypothetical protein
MFIYGSLGFIIFGLGLAIGIYCGFSFIKDTVRIVRSALLLAEICGLRGNWLA